MDFQAVADTLNELSQTGSTLQKEAILKEHCNDEDFKSVLKYIFDPYFTTGLKQSKLNRVEPIFTELMTKPEELMQWLKENNTGTDYAASVALGFVLSSEDAVWQWAAEGLVTKDIQIGVSVTTLNKVYGRAFIPKVGIMRGIQAPKDFKGIYLATEKIDGNRRVIMNKESGVEVYTRSGKPDHGLKDIEDEIVKLPKGFVYDAELTAIGDFEDSIALRQATASIANRRNQKRSGVKALVFDVLTQREYDEGISRMGALGRKTMLAAMFGDTTSIDFMSSYFMELDEKNGLTTNYGRTVKALGDFYLQGAVQCDHIVPLPILSIIHDYEEAIAAAQPIWDTGGEGLMLVEYRSPYEVNPNPRKTLLKIKQTKEYKLRVEGVFEGRNKHEGRLGGVFVNYKGATVGVGSGFTDWERELYWEHPEKIVGKVIEIDSFGESQNQDGGTSLNCPIFKRIAGAQE